MCVTQSRPSTDDRVAAARRDFLAALIDAGLLIPSGVPGVYGRGGVFEDVVERFDRYVARQSAHLGAESLRFPPLFTRSHYLRTDHIETFPNLMGSVHSFTGQDREHVEMLRKKDQHEEWTRDLAPTEVMLTPAACYPLYPTAAGTLPLGGRTVELVSYVFRHEPSPDPARMQIFRMREYVRLGTPQEALAHRDDWVERAGELLRALGLDAQPVRAADPFFGRGSRMLAATQKEQDLKYELVVPVATPEQPTAVASSNYHLDHFAQAFGIHTADGQVAHSACVGFGLERVALALFKAHGFEPVRWPAAVKRALEL